MAAPPAQIACTRSVSRLLSLASPDVSELEAVRSMAWHFIEEEYRSFFLVAKSSKEQRKEQMAVSIIL
jgi:hypothetical protein